MTKPHPEGYEFGAPDGEWIGHFDDSQWGQNKNLILYFTDEGSGKRYWFSVFSTHDYCPRDKQINFKDEKAGGRYTIKTGRSAKGNPVFLGASRLPAL
jgi:hypothetical protein